MRLYVGNLSFKATEGDLQSFFADAGVNVDQVTVVRDKFSGEARGFGFAEVPDAEGENAVRLCNGKELMGRALVINEARPMTPGGGGGRPRGAGGGGGFGGDRRGGGESAGRERRGPRF
jgi:RNA recognition motif-containing protein